MNLQENPSKFVPPPVVKDLERVLVVDDSDLVIDLVKFALRNFPVSIVSATNADVALSVLKRGKVALIITDLRMPQMSGVDFLKRLRALPEYCYTPVVVISGYEEKAQMDAAIAAGANCFMKKPFTSEAIYDCVRREINAARTPPAKH